MYGNEDTFRELLRKQRAVEASYSHVRTDIVNMVQDTKQANEAGENLNGNGKRKFVAAGGEEGNAEEKKKGRKNEEEEVEVSNVAFQSVPASVFGELET